MVDMTFEMGCEVGQLLEEADCIQKLLKSDFVLVCQDLRLYGSSVVYWLSLMNTCISQKCSAVLSVLWHFVLGVWVGSGQTRQHCVEVRGQTRCQSLLSWARVFAVCLCSAYRRLMDQPAFGSLLCLPPSLCGSTVFTGVLYHTQT